MFIFLFESKNSPFPCKRRHLLRLHISTVDNEFTFIVLKIGMEVFGPIEFLNFRYILIFYIPCFIYIKYLLLTSLDLGVRVINKELSYLSLSLAFTYTIIQFLAILSLDPEISRKIHHWCFSWTLGGKSGFVQPIWYSSLPLKTCRMKIFLLLIPGCMWDDDNTRSLHFGRSVHRK